MAHSIHEESALRATDKSGYDELSELESTARMHMQKFLLYPKAWGEIPLLHHLDWQEVQFKPDSKSLVKDERGIYAFVIRITGKMVPPNGYITYIGKASSLKRRFGEYLREKNYNSKNYRYHISKMLNTWKDNIYFLFSTLTETVDEGAVESALINGLHPPCNRKDFKGSFSQAAREAFH